MQNGLLNNKQMSKQPFQQKRSILPLSSSYSEGRDLPSFDGKPHAEQARFFFAPPDDIGEIECAYTQMTEKDDLSPVKYKAIKVGLYVLVGAGIGLFISWIFGLSLMWSLVVIALPGFLAYLVGSEQVQDKTYIGCYLGNDGFSMGVVNSKYPEKININTIVFGEGLMSQLVNQQHRDSASNLRVHYLQFYKQVSPRRFEALAVIPKSDYLIRKIKEKWYSYYYNEIIRPALEEKGSFPFHSGVVFYKDGFTFQHEAEEIRVDRTNFHLLAQGTITSRKGSEETEQPYLFLQEEPPELDNPILLAPENPLFSSNAPRIGSGSLFSDLKDPIPIIPLVNEPGKYDVFDCELILWHVNYLKLYYELEAE